MDIDQEIKIIDLLGLREEQFLLIRRLEDSVRSLLPGVARVPFPPPPELPSRRTAARGRRTQIAPPIATKEAAIALPPLQKNRENAYRVRYWFKGEEKESFQGDPAFLQAIQQLQGETFKLLQIETVECQTAGEFQIVSELWRRPEGEGKQSETNFRG